MEKIPSFTYFDYRYLNFYKFNAHPSNFQTYRCTNTSIAHVTESIYLYAVRVIVNTKETQLIPGNDEDCIQKIDIGLNYWWNHWDRSSTFVGLTIFFLGNHKNNDLSWCHIQCVKPTKKLSKQFCYTSGYLVNNIPQQDVRIFKHDNVIYLHTLDLEYLCKLEVDISNKRVNIQQLNISLPKVDLSGINQQILQIKSLDNNEMFVRYIDWFLEYGTRIFGVLFDTSKKSSLGGSTLIMKYYNNTIPYDQFKFRGYGCYDNKNPDDISKYGTNYGIMPGFSLSTPHVTLENNLIIGCGHSKIHSDIEKYPYLEKSKIDLFRKNLYQDYKAEFGDKYIRHLGTGWAPNGCQGFIYMLYFYIVNGNELKNEKNHPGSMKISDSFLPLFLSTKEIDGPLDQNYKFSLIFPMGLARDNDKIIITAGEGDFYSVALEFKISDILDLCQYDVRNLDLRNYNYNILAYVNNHQFYMSETLRNIKQKMQQVGGKKYKLIK
jgi:hypothetical protein